jgi:hypothetical protein
MLDFSSWTWGLILIVLTTGIHSFGIALLVLLAMRIRFYLGGRETHFWEAISLPYTLSVLRRWKMAPVYCQAVLSHDQRITLDGTPAEPVDAEAKELATSSSCGT